MALDGYGVVYQAHITKRIYDDPSSGIIIPQRIKRHDYVQLAHSSGVSLYLRLDGFLRFSLFTGMPGDGIDMPFNCMSWSVAY